MAAIRSLLSLLGRRVWGRSTAEDDAETTNPDSSPASAEESAMVSTDATISKPSAINFLELPVEVRMMIYEYCYDTCSLTLQYGYGPQMQKTKCTKRSPLRQKMYGVPARIHQVCRVLAQETGPMWEKHTTSLLLENAATDNTCMSHFTIRPAFANLRHRLVSLEISNRHLPRIRSEFHIVWDRLLLRCSNLRNVTLTILNCGSTDVPWNLPRGLDSMHATEVLICYMMSEDSRSGEEMQLGRYDLLSLAAGLKSRHKGTYSVTASVRNIMNLTDWGSGNSLGLSYDMVGCLFFWLEVRFLV